MKAKINRAHFDNLVYNKSHSALLGVDMMKIEKAFLIVAIVAALLAIPVAHALNGYTQKIQIERTERQNLELKLDSTEKQLQQEEQKRQELEGQLQSKREAEAKVAQAQPVKPAAINLGGCEQYRPLVAQYSWNVEVALAVMKAESGCNPNAVSPTNDHGLFQLHAWPVYEPAENIRIAYENKYLRGGWRHWTVCTSGKVNCGI